MAEPAEFAVSSDSSWFEVRNVSVAYGRAAPVVRDVSLSVHPHEVVALIGSNGAGKTTLLRAISGLTRPQSGSVWLDGTRIDKLASHAIVSRGVVQVPEGRHLFPDMTVWENLLLGAHSRSDSHMIRDEAAQFEERFPILRKLSGRRAGTASGGEQQIVALVRALMAKPRLLLLDEPTTGLAPQIVAEVAKLINEVVVGYDVSIVLVEQNAKMALSVSQRGYVMEQGRVTVSGLSRALLHDDRVARAYLAVKSERPALPHESAGLQDRGQIHGSGTN